MSILRHSADQAGPLDETEAAAWLDMFEKGPVDSGAAIKLAPRLITSVIEGRVTAHVASLALGQIFTSIDRSMRAAGSADESTQGELVQVLVDALPATGPVSHELYEKLCFPPAPGIVAPTRAKLRQAGTAAGHTWPQASMLLERLIVVDEAFPNSIDMPSQGAPADYAISAWAAYLDGVDPQRREDLVLLAGRTGLQAEQVLRLAGDTLGGDHSDTPEVHPVRDYAHKVGNYPVSPLTEHMARGERMVAWCEEPSNQSAPGYLYAALDYLHEVKQVVTDVDSYFENSSYPPVPYANKTEEQCETWNRIAGDWAGRILRLLGNSPQYKEHWGRLPYLAQGIAGENIMTAAGGVELVDERGRIMLEALPISLSNLTRSFLANYGLGQLPSSYYKNLRPPHHLACTLLAYWGDEANGSDYGTWKERMDSKTNEELGDILDGLFTALTFSEDEFTEKARNDLAPSRRLPAARGVPPTLTH